MDGKELVRAYLDAMFGGEKDFDRARTFLADDLVYRGPMLEARNADDFIAQMRAIGARAGAMKAEIQHVLRESDLVAALYQFSLPSPVTFAEWFRIRDGKISAITIVHDTAPYRGRQ
jgi:hypothetical protein